MFALAEATLVLIGTCVTAVASIVAAAIGIRVRRENSSQHGESREALHRLVGKVDEHGRKLDQIAARVDHAHSRLDNHRSRRWFR